jgi:phosphoenolpyruvate carboxykinase (GTP)
MEIESNILDDANLKKLKEVNNPKVLELVEKYIKHCKPAKVTVITDSQEDIDYIRQIAITNKEERKLAMEGHTIHWDGIKDQARDKLNTKVLITPDMKLSKVINTGDRETHLEEVLGYMEGIMEGKEMFIRFFCLGPKNSKFSISALQLTDSAYVCHSEDILYRTGYEQFKGLNGSEDFFFFLHSAGKLDDRGNTVNIDQRRIYIDVTKNEVFTANNQYAGNSLGLKKLALRLAINKSNKEDWLCEHMFIMGLKPEGKERTTYFTGAYPSACGKTSTAMVPGQSIVGDDIAYIRPGEDGKAYAANVEQGIFGIITDVNPVDDPVIYKTITSPRELVVSNVLVNNGTPYWLNMGKDIPDEGENFTGEWEKGKTDEQGKEISPAHKNARYTIRISELENADENLNNPDGVAIDGFIYGGRDSDTSPPVLQSLSWAHGVFIGACLESETTAATLGQEGVRKLSPMANMDFLVVPLGTYIQNHIKFGESLDKCPQVFATNYFLKENGKFLNEKVDKKVWLMWMEGRVNNEYQVIETPIGLIPKYEDLKELFQQIFNKEYSKEQYDKEFSIRINNYLEKMTRIEEIYKAEEDIPEIFHTHLEQQRQRLRETREKYGKDVILPSDF